MFYNDEEFYNEVVPKLTKKQLDYIEYMMYKESNDNYQSEDLIP